MKEPKGNVDEPLLNTDVAPPAAGGFAVRDRVDRLLREQPYAVLSLQSEGQPYGALVAYAVTLTLDRAVFATPVYTRKYKMLTESDRVALVIDNRSTHTSELMEIEAVTATGRASLIERGDQYDIWADLLLARHAYLQPFLSAASCALFRVDVTRYLHVVRFQEVNQWIPKNDAS